MISRATTYPINPGIRLNVVECFSENISWRASVWDSYKTAYIQRDKMSVYPSAFTSLAKITLYAETHGRNSH